MILSGNFGEIRSDHFHSGIDIKTQGAIGHHVFSIKEGYVSRIKVQANGYGKSIYLNHPNGTTSVYGHLDRYRDDIADYVKKVQYERNSHQVDIYPEEDLFKVEKGEFIAYSGNTGGSFGPHLHFEVRNSANQHPTNALKYGFRVRDELAPRFHHLYVYGTENQGRTSYPLLKDQGVYTVKWGTRLQASGATGLGVEVFDYLNGASNRCGVYELECYVNDTLVYSHVMDEFSFSETRYVNASTDYHERAYHKKKVHRLYRLPNDKLRIYRELVDDGIFTVGPGKMVPVRIVARDVAGNESVLQFKLAGVAEANDPSGNDPDGSVAMDYRQSNHFQASGARVDIPAGALYESIRFNYREGNADNETLTPFHQIHDKGIPVHKTYTLSLKVPDSNKGPLDKITIVSRDEEDGSLEAHGGEYQDGFVSTGLKSFGAFALALDTLAPEIIPLNGSGSGDLSGKKVIRFQISDSCSGIDSYDAYIDNRWALFEYDPKNDLLSYRFDSSRLSSGQEHELELYVRDATGNIKLYHHTFKW